MIRAAVVLPRLRRRFAEPPLSLEPDTTSHEPVIVAPDGAFYPLNGFTSCPMGSVIVDLHGFPWTSARAFETFALLSGFDHRHWLYRLFWPVARGWVLLAWPFLLGRVAHGWRIAKAAADSGEIDSMLCFYSDGLIMRSNGYVQGGCDHCYSYDATFDVTQMFCVETRSQQWGVRPLLRCVADMFTASVRSLLCIDRLRRSYWRLRYRTAVCRKTTPM